MEKNKGGRKPKYDYEDQMFLLQIEGWARDGFDDKQIAQMLKLDETYFCKQKSKFPQLSQALTRGRRPLEVLVENGLFKRATGMKVTKTSVTKKREYNPVTEEYEIVIYDNEEVTELPPDVGAINLWLRNRKPDKWNKQPVKVANTDPSGEKASAPLLFLSADKFTEEQIQAFINQNIGQGTDEDEAGSND